jgi:hypothetical protein
MGLAQFRSMPQPGTPARHVYDFAHYQDHVAIVKALRTVPFHQIYPVVDLKIFLQRHQALHDDMNRAARITRKVNLLILDDKKDSDRNNWSWLNYQQHLQIRQAFAQGLGSDFGGDFGPDFGVEFNA